MGRQQGLVVDMNKPNSSYFNYYILLIVNFYSAIMLFIPTIQITDHNVV